MSTLMEELTALKTSEDKITGNKVANFAYDDYAYEHEDANGVDTYNVNNHQNIPNGTANILKVNATILTKGWRAQASAITRMLIDHFLGRCSYNLNKINDHFSALLTKLMGYLGAPDGIATLDEDGNVPASQVSLTKIGLGNVVNTGDSAVPVSGGTDKLTTGGLFKFITGLVPAEQVLVQGGTAVVPKEGIVYDVSSGYFYKNTSNTAQTINSLPSINFSRVSPMSYYGNSSVIIYSAEATSNVNISTALTNFIQVTNTGNSSINITWSDGSPSGLSYILSLFVITASTSDSSTGTVKFYRKTVSTGQVNVLFSLPASSIAFICLVGNQNTIPMLSAKYY